MKHTLTIEFSVLALVAGCQAPCPPGSTHHNHGEAVRPVADSDSEVEQYCRIIESWVPRESEWIAEVLRDVEQSLTRLSIHAIDPSDGHVVHYVATLSAAPTQEQPRLEFRTSSIAMTDLVRAAMSSIAARPDEQALVEVPGLSRRYVRYLVTGDGRWRSLHSLPDDVWRDLNCEYLGLSWPEVALAIREVTVRRRLSEALPIARERPDSALEVLLEALANMGFWIVVENALDDEDHWLWRTVPPR